MNIKEAQEKVQRAADQLDQDIERAHARYESTVGATERWLAGLRRKAVKVVAKWKYIESEDLLRHAEVVLGDSTSEVTFAGRSYSLPTAWLETEEVPEIERRLRKQDLEALKAFMSDSSKGVV